MELQPSLLVSELLIVVTCYRQLQQIQGSKYSQWAAKQRVSTAAQREERNGVGRSRKLRDGAATPCSGAGGG